MLFFCNEDYKVLLIQQSSGIPNQSPQKIEVKSSKCLCLNKQTITNTLTIIQSNCTLPGYTFNSGVGTVKPTAQKCLCESKFPLRQTDEGICNGTFTNNVNGAVLNCVCKILLNNAGNNKDQGN